MIRLSPPRSVFVALSLVMTGACSSSRVVPIGFEDEEETIPLYEVTYWECEFPGTAPDGDDAELDSFVCGSGTGPPYPLEGSGWICENVADDVSPRRPVDCGGNL